MRIDPKFFNIFIAICAVVGVIVIFYSTVRYSQNQASDFEKNISEIRIDTLSFRSFSKADSLHLNKASNYPLIIQFWATWSDKSKTVNDFLNDYKKNHPNLAVISAAVRDSDAKVREYMNQNSHSFQYVDGTDLYHSVLVPGIPSQVLIDEHGEFFDTHIGDDIESLEKQLNLMLRDGR